MEGHVVHPAPGPALPPCSCDPNARKVGPHTVATGGLEISPVPGGQAQPPTSRNQVAFNKIRREVSPTASVSAGIYDRLIKVKRIIRMIMTVLPSSLEHNLQKTKLVELYKISQLTLFNLLKREVYCRALKQDAGLVTSASTFTPT